MLPALRQEAETAVAGAALPEAREQPQREGPGPSRGERLSEEEGGEGEVGDDIRGGKRERRKGAGRRRRRLGGQ